MHKGLIPAFGLLLTVLNSGGNAAIGSEPLIVAGLPLGQPFTMPQCEKSKEGKRKHLANGPCWTFAFENDHAFRAIQWPDLKMPPIGINWIAVVHDGILDAVSMDTLGVEFQDPDLRQLVEKFGKPLSIETQGMQNYFGMQVQKVTAEWNDETVYVSFESCCLVLHPRIDRGRVWIQTASSRAEEIKKIEEEKRKHPGPKL